MKRAIVLAAVALSTTAMGADEAKKASDAPPKEAHKVLPEVSLDTASGDGKLSIKWGPVFHIANDWDLQFAGLYTASTSDGIASLFQVTGDTIGISNDWSAGPNLTFGYLAHDELGAEDVALEDEGRRRAYAICLVRCPPARKVLADEDKPFCEQVPGQMDAAELCPTVKAVPFDPKTAKLDEWLKARNEQMAECLKACDSPNATNSTRQWCSKPLTPRADAYQHVDIDAPKTPGARSLCPTGRAVFAGVGRKLATHTASSFPRALLNVGLKAGQSHFSFLAPSAQVSGQVEQSKNAPFNVSMGASAVFVLGQGSHSNTVEALFNFSAAWQSASDKAHWCKPANPVIDATQPAGDSAQICKDTAYGAPKRANKITGAFYYGTVDQAQPFYRIAFGVQADYWTLGGDDQARLGFGIPVTFALFQSKDIGYNGLLRIAPTIGITWHRDQGRGPHVGGSDFDFGIAISLSAQKYLFSQQFDRL